jgi:hypothetical protein
MVNASLSNSVKALYSDKKTLHIPMAALAHAQLISVDQLALTVMTEHLN